MYKCPIGIVTSFVFQKFRSRLFLIALAIMSQYGNIFFGTVHFYRPTASAMKYRRRNISMRVTAYAPAVIASPAVTGRII